MKFYKQNEKKKKSKTDAKKNCFFKINTINV